MGSKNRYYRQPDIRYTEGMDVYRLRCTAGIVEVAVIGNRGTVTLIVNPPNQSEYRFKVRLGDRSELAKEVYEAVRSVGYEVE